jgi:acetate kinase
LAERHPHLPQLACFDTAFHAGMPPVANLLPIPGASGQGHSAIRVSRLSYAYLIDELARLSAGPAAAAAA